MPEPSPTSADRRPIGIFSWAFYLACSWTWCIGMFLPALLVRDLGHWGFVAFAIPNVIGAAAMGWILSSREQARRIATRHSRACAAFSLVTIAFQMYFLVGMSSHLARGSWPPLLPILAAIIVGTLLARGWRWGGIVAWIISTVVLAAAINQQCQTVIRLPAAPALPVIDSLWLAPVCCFGFLLCPYLDLTFLRVRVSTSPSQARAAFSLGFGILFLVMIVGTYLYAPTALYVLGNSVSTPPLWIRTTVPALLSLHIAHQIAYTIGVHSREARRRMPAYGLDFGLLALIVFAVSTLLTTIGLNAGLTRFELGYRLFMTFYGLVFPGYVWLCMIPCRGEFFTQSPAPGKVRVLLIACILAAPLFWIGFIQRETIALVPGLAIILASRLFARA